MKTQDAIDHFGTQDALARVLGLEQPSISAWVKTEKESEIHESGIPYLRQLQIQLLTKGKLKAGPNTRKSKKNIKVIV